jgi:ribosome maturation factor RimP
MEQELSRQIEELAVALLEKVGVELFRLSIVRRKGKVMMEILADKPTGGITLDECAALNRQIIGAIDGQNLIDEDYLLELSSPGLDWPLKTAKDFRRALNRQVRVVLSQPVGEKWEYTGIVQEVMDNDFVLLPVAGRSGKKKGESPILEVVIPFEKIVKAVQMI